MKISARNTYSATITAIEKGAVNAQISLLTSKGVKLTSVITLTSAEDMALEVGDTVTAFFKASHVILSTSHLTGISARNQLEGVIEGEREGVVNMEVVIVMQDGEHIVAIITEDAAKDLGIVPGQSVVAVIKSTDIMLAK